MNKPRIAIGGLQHETNTFASIATTLDSFMQPAAWPGLTEGRDVLHGFTGANLPISGFIDASDDCELVPLFWAAAEPSGYVQKDAFDHLTGKFVDQLKDAGELDAIYLDLHGAMVTREHADAEAEILRRIRAQVGEQLPIAVSLDLHGNLSPAFFELASCVTIYRTYPHVDLADTGARAKQLLMALLAHGRPLAKAYRQLDFIIPITAQSTFTEPAKTLYQSLNDYQNGSVLSADIALGFPPADIPDNGPAIFVYGTDDTAVDLAADKLQQEIALAESRFVNPMITTGEAVDRALRLGESANKPVVIADPQDNPGAGGTGNTTGILQCLLDAGAKQTALSMIWDPDTASVAHAAGVGSTIDISLGGRPGEAGNLPIVCQAVVENTTDGVFEFSGEMYAGSTGRLGKCAVLKITQGSAEVRVVVVSVRCQNADLAMFTAFGLDPLSHKILVVKSAVHFLAAYKPIAHEVLFAKSVGENNCDLQDIPYTRLRQGLRVGPLGKPFTAV